MVVTSYIEFYPWLEGYRGLCHICCCILIIFGVSIYKELALWSTSSLQHTQTCEDSKMALWKYHMIRTIKSCAGRDMHYSISSMSLTGGCLRKSRAVLKHYKNHLKRKDINSLFFEAFDVPEGKFQGTCVTLEWMSQNMLFAGNNAHITGILFLNCMTDELQISLVSDAPIWRRDSRALSLCVFPDQRQWSMAESNIRGIEGVRKHWQGMGISLSRHQIQNPPTSGIDYSNAENNDCGRNSWWHSRWEYLNRTNGCAA